MKKKNKCTKAILNSFKNSKLSPKEKLNKQIQDEEKKKSFLRFLPSIFFFIFN